MNKSATEKCTPQWASSGSAHPCLWSLPIAIQEVCRTKSAMTCLAVRSNIHPIRTPTGTDADMGGNDKLKPSDLNDWRMMWRLQRDFFLLAPDKSDRGSLFYDISGSRMHHHRFRKPQGVAE